ncbi:glycosyltransferase [bacterium]|nr:glycosyltransferase [bacterium]
MRNFLVIQWARLGDLLQTRVLLDLIRRAHPQSRIALSYDVRYNDVVALFPEVDDSLPLDIQAIVRSSGFQETLPDAADEILSASDACKFDEVINLTNHAAACWYAHFMASNQVRGYRIHNGNPAIPAELQSLLHSSDLSRAPSHIADIWRSLLPSDEQPRVPPPLIETDESSREYAAIISDAGSPERSLTPDALRAWSKTLHSKFADRIIWTGARLDRAAMTPGFVEDLRGRTSLSSLVSLLSKCDLVVGPDTGALHLAAALGCRVVGVYLNGARPERTGPYSLSSRCFAFKTLDETAVNTVSAILHASLEERQYTHGAVEYEPAFSRPGIWYCRSATKTRHSADKPLLSVVIPEFAQTHYVDAVLPRLASDVSLPNLEIIVCSSGLTSYDKDHARTRSEVKAIVSETPLSFAQACNRAARAAQGEWILFLNDDTDFESEALVQLWKRRDPNAIIAPELRFWDGECQSAGFIIRADNVDELCASDDLENQTQPDGVSAAAMLVHVNLYRKLSGFDEGYRNGYEDVDFCLRAREIGVMSRCIREARFTHYRGSSPTRYDHEERNKSLLLNRWCHIAGPRAKTSPTAVHARCLLISSCLQEEAGPQSRWLDPLRRLGVQSGDYAWIHADSEADTAKLRESLSAAKTVVVFRGIGSKATCEEILAWKSRTNGTLLLDADDLILNRFPTGSSRAAMRRNEELEFETLQQAADFCSAPSSRLLELHGVRTEIRRVTPPAPIAEHFHSKQWTRADSLIRIGFAASWAHQTDFAQAAPAVEAFLDRHEDVLFYWWGCHPGKLAYHPQVRHGGPWTRDYARHLARMRRVPIDFWIAPLSDSVHNSVRSPIRAFEYCGMGSPCIVSNVDPYRSLPSKSGLLTKCDNTFASWMEAFDAQRCFVKAPSNLLGSDTMLDYMREQHENATEFQRLWETLAAESRSLRLPAREKERLTDDCEIRI